MAMPAAAVTACCSAMPTSKHAVGEALGERQQPGGAGHARGDGDDLGPLLGQRDERVAERGGVRRSVRTDRHAGLGVERADVVEALLVVGLGGEVALALVREHVHDDGTVAVRGVAQHRLERGDVVTVDRADVVETEGGEERRRIARLAARVPGDGEARHGGRVAAAVVVEHDHRAAPGGAEVVERLVGEAAGEGAVADHGDHCVVVAAVRQGGVARHRQPVGVAHRGGRVAVLDQVVLGLRPRRVARHPAALAEAAEAVEPAGDELVHVGLVAGVPDDGVARASRTPGGGPG